jgi:hypothetical protein
MSRGGQNWKGGGTVEGSRSLDVTKLARAGYLAGSRTGGWQWTYQCLSGIKGSHLSRLAIWSCAARRVCDSIGGAEREVPHVDAEEPLPL